jgi:hypothetical protein
MHVAREEHSFVYVRDQALSVPALAAVGCTDKHLVRGKRGNNRDDVRFAVRFRRR